MAQTRPVKFLPQEWNERRRTLDTRAIEPEGWEPETFVHLIGCLFTVPWAHLGFPSAILPCPPLLFYSLKFHLSVAQNLSQSAFTPQNSMTSPPLNHAHYSVSFLMTKRCFLLILLSATTLTPTWAQSLEDKCAINIDFLVSNKYVQSPVFV